MLSKILIAVALVLLGLKFGLRTRLRELGRALDRIVNLLLIVIAAVYCLQLGLIYLTKR